MSKREPLHLSVAQCVDHIVETFGRDIRIAMPLGLGKPIPLINALYQRARKDSTLELTIFTALSLEKPVWNNPLERRLLEPFVERVWGGVPDLEFLRDLRLGEVPPNVHIHELFFKAGAYNHHEGMQQNHICSNYTHVVRDCTINNNQIFAHMIARVDDERERCYSASCNADTALMTLKLFADAQARGEKRLRIGMVNRALPFMYGDAELSPGDYDVIIDEPAGQHALFSTPRLPVTDGDYLIGLQVSALIKDGGTLQIGIGTLGDAIAYGLDLRHNHNAVYTALLRESGIAARYAPLIESTGGTAPFAQGLYGSTEMLVDGFLQLYKSGVIKRPVYRHAGIQSLLNQGRMTPQAIPDDVLEMMLAEETLHPYLTRKEFLALQHIGVFKPELRYDDGCIVSDTANGGELYSAHLSDADNLRRIGRECLGSELKNGVLLTGGFFIGPRDFYDTLRTLPEAELRQFEMTGVEDANQLYGNEGLRALQRKDGRFCNTALKATLLGNIVSDGLEDGTVVSGVGGQYNFVAMAHALPDARLVMMLKSTRHEGGKTLSNIVYNYGHVTIPRHLRDIIVTEYGIADIRGRSDAEIIQAMLNVADSRFQGELLAEAKRHKKLPEGYEIPERYRHNTPERLSALLKSHKTQGLFPPFPYGSEFTRAEMILAQALKGLKARSAPGHEAEMAAAMKSLPPSVPPQVLPLLERMGLEAPASAPELQMQKTVLLALHLAGVM
jgi:acyl-CoA hydrolase